MRYSHAVILVVAVAAACSSCAGKASNEKTDSTAAKSASAQAPASPSNPLAPAPATQLEAFKPSAGSVTTMGFDQLGTVEGIKVQARELRDDKGTSARGLIVEVRESQYREERSFVDLDELPELLRAVDAIAAVKVNPTKFENYQIDYTTRGGLRVVGFNNTDGSIHYAVEVGRVTKAESFLTAAELTDFRSKIASAVEHLNAKADK